MIKSIIAAIQQRLEQNREYNRLVAEIEALNARDLAELRADPIEMRRAAFTQVYGRSHG